MARLQAEKEACENCCRIVAKLLFLRDLLKRREVAWKQHQKQHFSQHQYHHRSRRDHALRPPRRRQRPRPSTHDRLIRRSLHRRRRTCP